MMSQITNFYQLCGFGQTVALTIQWSVAGQGVSDMLPYEDAIYRKVREFCLASLMQQLTTTLVCLRVQHPFRRQHGLCEDIH